MEVNSVCAESVLGLPPATAVWKFVGVPGDGSGLFRVPFGRFLGTCQDVNVLGRSEWRREVRLPQD